MSPSLPRSTKAFSLVFSPEDAPASGRFSSSSRVAGRLFVITLVQTIGTTAIVSLTMTRQYRLKATLEIRPRTPLVAADSQDPAMNGLPKPLENYYYARRRRF